MNEQMIFPQPHAAGNQPSQLTPEMQEEFCLLMSLRLDALLDQHEEARFQRYLNEHQACANEWEQWQHLHGNLLAEPAVMPSADFLRKVEAGVAQAHRRQQLWQGLAVGLFAMLLWSAMLVGIVAITGYVLVNNGSAVSELIHGATYFSAVTARWLATIRTTISTFLSTPQATALGIGYLTLSALLLSFWVRFLYRSTETNRLGEMNEIVSIL